MSENLEIEREAAVDTYLDKVDSERNNILALASTVNPTRKAAKEEVLDT